MNDIELEVEEDGTVRTMWQDGVDKLIGGDIKAVQRASNIEWEKKANGEAGWSVRAAHDPEFAARLTAENCAATVKPLREGELVLFNSRFDALEWERRFFWDLLPKRTTG